MEADVICVCFLAFVVVSILALHAGERHDNDDGEPPFHSALETRVRGHGLSLEDVRLAGSVVQY